MENSALLIIDIQNGSLSVPGCNQEYVKSINKIKKNFNTVILTQDSHPINHCSFQKNNPGSTLFKQHNKQIMWPVHCVQNTHGWRFHDDLDISESDIIIQKGTQIDCDSYSAFWDNDYKYKTNLSDILHSKNIDTVYVCGVAVEYCLKFTCLDALKEGFRCFISSNYCRGLCTTTTNDTLTLLKQKGVCIY